MNTNTNIGWYYYREYFNLTNLDKVIIDEAVANFEKKNKNITNTPFVVEPLYKASKGLILLRMETTYPGLLMGAGYAHEIKAEGELKLGLSFDHTTGLPYLPGSSVKGILRSAFPKWDSDPTTPENIKRAKNEYIYDYLQGQEANSEQKKQQVIAWEQYIFEGKILKQNNKDKAIQVPLYERFIFLDAYLEQGDAAGKILGTDAITPHIHKDKSYEEALLKNPVPVAFLKILPEVIICFPFQIPETIPKELELDEAKIRNLFINILKDFGVGAKTNVGYGNLKDLDESKKNETTTIQHRKQEQNPSISERLKAPSLPLSGSL
ncbi:MAG: type III-B CRISPR module RAMP protein Cmr6 [Sphingobacteriales bacterium]|nr:type III-B CRISPR module RAMP protein Cmr6 [Sphingobacteriales bacterium]